MVSEAHNTKLALHAVVRTPATLGEKTVLQQLAQQQIFKQSVVHFDTNQCACLTHVRKLPYHKKTPVSYRFAAWPLNANCIALYHSSTYLDAERASRN